MFSPLPMKHVMLQVMTDELPQVSLTLAELAVFSPDHRPAHEESFPIIPGEHFRELYNQAGSGWKRSAGISRSPRWSISGMST